MTARRLIALLGRRDEPTDAVEEYCQHLGAALVPHGFQMDIRRVPWNDHGWAASLEALRLQSEAWRGTWVLVQYTALAWSARGFPRKFLRVLRVLRKAGARIAVVFHDVEPYGGIRFIDRFRSRTQIQVMRRTLGLVDLAVFTVPLQKVSWLPFTSPNAVYTDSFAPSNSKLDARTIDALRHRLGRSGSDIVERVEVANRAADQPHLLSRRAHFIPVGPNLPIPYVMEPSAELLEENERANARLLRSKGILDAQGLKKAPKGTPTHAGGLPTVGIFSITGGLAGTKETSDIIAAVRYASQKFGGFRLSVFGRHAESRERALREGLRNLPIDITVEGVLDDHQIVDRLKACDVLLFVRGGISTRRSSAIAGIACGVPMIAYVGSETSWPITDAGVVLVSPDAPDEVGSALVRLLTDSEFHAGLALTNYFAYNAHFSWSVIASRFAALLGISDS